MESKTSISGSSLTPKAPRIAPFTKVLVANRGEIAVRVIRSCRALGLHTVAVYSTADSDSLHVRCADEAVLLGPPINSESYLNIRKIINACKATGAQAVHPGYGFLSENAEFAQACANHDIVFIGPSSHVMNTLGNKAAAKAYITQHCPEVPLIPGYDGLDQSVDTLTKEAMRIGFPLLCKAAAGGGGKGMRVVRSVDELQVSIESAISEAKSSFGDSRLLLERYFENSHHVEMQIMGDSQGDVVCIGSRECSVQRRYQKIIEEAPAFIVYNKALEQKMSTAAIALAKATGYVNAGTVEFLVAKSSNNKVSKDNININNSSNIASDDDYEFYFLEINTRLQVEHPITEVTSGLDLVNIQLYVSMGYTLQQMHLSNINGNDGVHGSDSSGSNNSLENNDQLASSIRLGYKGNYAIECRLYAEDPNNQFYPATGKLLAFSPYISEGIRYDCGVENNSTISIYYDPLIAKVITWGATRQEAVKRMIIALSNTILMGVTTNRQFLIQALSHDKFIPKLYDTTFINKHFPPHQRLLQFVHSLLSPSASFPAPYLPPPSSSSSPTPASTLSPSPLSLLSMVATIADWLRRRHRRTVLGHVQSGYNANMLTRYTATKLSFPQLLSAINTVSSLPDLSSSLSSPSTLTSLLPLFSPFDLYYNFDATRHCYASDPTANRSLHFTFKSSSEEQTRLANLILAPTIIPPRKSKKNKTKSGDKASSTPTSPRPSSTVTTSVPTSTAPTASTTTTTPPAPVRTGPLSSDSLTNPSTILATVYAYAPLLATPPPSINTTSTTTTLGSVGSNTTAPGLVIDVGFTIETPSASPPPSSSSSSLPPSAPALSIRRRFIVTFGEGHADDDDSSLDVWVQHPDPHVGSILIKRHSRFESSSSSSTTEGSSLITAPMPCKILNLVVPSGSKVVKKQHVITVESMKMELRITADADGIFTPFVKPGDVVKDGTKLCTITKEEPNQV